MRKTISKRGRPVDSGKRDRIIEIATKLFMQNGFNATSMDKIAREAGMSKLTLYSRFPDKNMLFVEVIASRCRHYVPDELFDLLNISDPHKALCAVGKAIFSLIMSDEATSLYRMMVSNAANNPELTKLFYDNGPKRLKKMLTKKMRQMDKAKILKITDAEAAADLMTSMLKGSDLYMRSLLNIGRKPSRKEIETLIARAADMFVRAHKA